MEQLLSRGNTVVATGRAAAAAAEQLRPLSEAHPERLLVTELDVASGTSVTGWAAALKERHGLKHVDVRARLWAQQGRGGAGTPGRPLRSPRLSEPHSPRRCRGEPAAAPPPQATVAPCSLHPAPTTCPGPEKPSQAALPPPPPLAESPRRPRERFAPTACAPPAACPAPRLSPPNPPASCASTTRAYTRPTAAAQSSRTSRRRAPHGHERGWAGGIGRPLGAPAC